MDSQTSRFSGHQSFSLRNTWLTKGVLACAADHAVFRAPDALVSFGVGKNMVDAIKYWCLATQMIVECSDERYAYEPTGIAQGLFVDSGGWDPYLEDESTLWLIHWLLATNPSVATTIYYAFNEWPSLEFTRLELETAIGKLAQRTQARASRGTIVRDVAVLVRTYLGGTDRKTSSIEDALDSPLADLGLLVEEPSQQAYAFVRGPKDTLPDAVLGYALDQYWQSKGQPTTLTFDELAYFELSPGRVFKLDEPALAERLERVAELTMGAWQPTETAGFRQVTVRREIDADALLAAHYSRHALGVANA